MLLMVCTCYNYRSIIVSHGNRRNYYIVTPPRRAGSAVSYIPTHL